MAGLFQVLWGQADGTFKKAATLNDVAGNPLLIPSTGDENVIESICTRPTAVDWDADGDLDLVVGNFAGSFYLFTGEGRGKFAAAAHKLKAGDQPLKIKGHHSDPFFVDWDGDGDLDLLSGAADGGVQWAENTAGARKAIALKEFKPLIARAENVVHECRPNEVVAPAHSTRVWVADVNGDRKLDVLVGDSINLISPREGVSEADFTKRYAAWKDAMAALTKETEDVTDPEKLAPIHDRMNTLHEQRSEFISEDMTGFVWVYLQK